MSITKVNRDESASVSAVSSRATSARSHTTGNTLVALVAVQSGNSVTVTDTAGNTYTQKGSTITSGSNRIATFVAFNITGHASNVVTATLSSGTGIYFGLSVYEFSGNFGVGDPTDDTAGAIGSGTAIDAGSLTLSGPEGVIVAIVEADGGVSSAGSGYTKTDFSTINPYFVDEYKIVSAGENATATGVSGNWGIAAVLLTEISGVVTVVSKSGDHYADDNTAWVGDVAPVPGVNPIEIAAGSTIRVRDQQDWGLDTALPTSSYDIVIKNTGTVIIEGTGTLTLHGNVNAEANGSSVTPYIDIEDGGKLEFYDAYYITNTDETLASWQLRYIKGRGEFEISARVGASSGGWFRGAIQKSQCDFIGTDSDHPFRILRMGGASQPWFDMGTDPGDCRMIFENGYTDECGPINSAGNISTNDVCRFKNFSTFNSLADYSVQLSGTGTPTGSGQLLMQNVALDKGITASGSNITGFTFDNVSVYDGIWGVGGEAVSFTDLFIASPASTDGNFVMGIRAIDYVRPIVVSRAGAVNQKVSHFTGSPGTGPFSIDDLLVVHLDATTADGEYVASTGNLSDGDVAVFTRPIFLPYKDGTATHICEVANDATSRTEFIHGTMAASNPHSVGFGHTGHNNPTADRYRLKSSIVYNFSNITTCNKISWISNDIADCIDPTQADYNCGWGLTDQLQASRYSNAAVGYQQKQTDTSTLPGVHDVDVDPWTGRTDVSDFMRMLAKWAGTLGITGTDAEKEEKALKAIHARFVPSHADYVAGATNFAFGEYVRGQVHVTNPLIATAGEDSEPIGAGEYVAASTGRRGMNHRTLRPY